MLNFLFWNVGGESLSPIIASLVRAHSVDILILAENTELTGAILAALNPKGQRADFFIIPSLAAKVSLFCKFPSRFVQPIGDDGRVSLRQIVLPGRTPFLLCAAHLPSKLRMSPEDQADFSIDVNRFIRDAEKRLGHSSSVVVGVLNMNPFERGLMSTMAFNAVGSRSIAERRSRTHSATEHPFFFNPMWQFYAEAPGVPQGTFYHRSPGMISLYWHLIDQVLIRPALLPYFDTKSVKLLDQHSSGSLLGRNGLPFPSDHLPIFFSVNI
jgi:hypothetical protein